MTLFSTIVAGVTVFVLGQILLKWVIEPIQQLREVISEIIYHFANDYSIIQNAHITDKEVALSVCKELERLGAKLLSKQHLIPFYAKIHKFLRLPEENNLFKASKKLSLISKSMFGKEPDIHYKLDIYRKQVCEYLIIQDPIQDDTSIEELKKQVAEIRNINA